MFSLCNANSQDMAKVVVSDYYGAVSMKAPGGEFVPVRKGMPLSKGYIIRTAKNAMLTLEFTLSGERAFVDIEENSEMLIGELKYDITKKKNETFLDLAIGKMLVTAKDIADGSEFQVKTPTSIVRVEGSTFSVEVENTE